MQVLSTWLRHLTICYFLIVTLCVHQQVLLWDFYQLSQHWKEPFYKGRVSFQPDQQMAFDYNLYCLVYAIDVDGVVSWELGVMAVIICLSLGVDQIPT